MSKILVNLTEKITKDLVFDQINNKRYKIKNNVIEHI